MANRYYKQQVGSIEAGVVKLYGSVVTSTSGTIASQSTKGFSIAKTGSEVGRYTVTLEDKYNGLLACSVAVEGSADAGYTSGKGLASFLRNADVVTGPSFDIQFADAATPQADAELEDAASFYVEISLKNSTAF